AVVKDPDYINGKKLLDTINELAKKQGITVEVSLTAMSQTGTGASGNDSLGVNPYSQRGIHPETKEQIMTIRTGDKDGDVEIGSPLEATMYHELTHILHGLQDKYEKWPTAEYDNLNAAEKKIWERDWLHGTLEHSLEEKYTTIAESKFREYSLGLKPR